MIILIMNIVILIASAREPGNRGSRGGVAVRNKISNNTTYNNNSNDNSNSNDSSNDSSNSSKHNNKSAAEASPLVRKMFDVFRSRCRTSASGD